MPDFLHISDTSMAGNSQVRLQLRLVLLHVTAASNLSPLVPYIR